jgi:uncharacterized protein (DUF608 family)
MKNKSNRRSFLKKVGAVSATAAAVPTTFTEANEHNEQLRKETYSPQKQVSEKRAYNSPYLGEYNNRLAFPIGGIGTGMFCLEGAGAISHMSLRHRPELFNEPSMFAAISLKGLEKGAKVLEGPVPDWKKFGQHGAGNGLGSNTYGLPRFNQVTFKARFPFGIISLQDDDIPLEITITGWNPFIPNDPDNSSLPVGTFEYQFKNTSSQPLEGTFSYNAKNFLAVQNGEDSIKKTKNGFILSEKGTEDSPHLKADFAIVTDSDDAVVDHCWFRGGWWDPLTMVWDDIKSGDPKSVDPVPKDAPGASVYVPLRIGPGEEKTVKVFMAWYVPDSNIRHGNDEAVEEDSGCDPESGCCASPSEINLGKYDKDFANEYYKPWYSNRFINVEDVVRHLETYYSDLYKKSMAFTESFYASTLPEEVLEAAAANLTILKSTTVMRQYDGRLWNYEGSGDTWGCCHGTCTHVWNYAQAIPHLFPSLERSLRHTEFCENQNSEGHQLFRAFLPIRPGEHTFYSAADGQLGGIMKVYREWRISGDNDWLRMMYPMVKTSMEYCIRTWDPREVGVLEEPHHNTYDIEFWGPNGMCSSFYLGALMAMIKMGEFMGDKGSRYKKLYKKGKKYLEEELYDGEYFFQKIMVEGLNVPNPIEASQKSMGGHYSEEARELLEKEGPKYQYGNGCISDGVLGCWIARMCGLDEPMDVEKTNSHLKAVYKYNLKHDLSDHVNPQRPTYAMGHEGGLLLCSWPKGGKPSLPFVYSNEVWTGIEYQVASHLMLSGYVEEGLDIVRTCRDRYDGKVRNPFNEYECGNWYARALASYGLIQGLTGMRFDAVEKTLYVDSKIGDFTSFISTNSGFGTVTVEDNKVMVNAVEGAIPVERVIVSGEEGALI